MAYNWSLNPTGTFDWTNALGTGYATDPANAQALYNAFIPQTRSQNFLDYWQSQFARVQQDYKDRVTREAMTPGGTPSLNWEDYLKQMNPFAGSSLANPRANPTWGQDNTFMNKWQSLSPQNQGQMNTPRVGWNTWW